MKSRLRPLRLRKPRYHQEILDRIGARLGGSTGDPRQARVVSALERALAVDPGGRCGTAREMREAIIPALRDCPELALAAPLSRPARRRDADTSAETLPAEDPDAGAPERG